MSKGVHFAGLDLLLVFISVLIFTASGVTASLIEFLKCKLVDLFDHCAYG